MNRSGDIPGVLCAGRLYCDLVFTGVRGMPELGRETFADGLDLHAGGGAFITAATLHALGRNAALIATFPAAPFDHIVRTDIVNNGVDHSRCNPATLDLDPQITVAISTQNDRSFLSRRTGNALPIMTAKTFSNLCHLHIGELRTLLENPDLITFARDAKMTISLDCGWDEEAMGRICELLELIALVDVFLPNEAEETHLATIGWKESTAPLTVVKCGNKGARAFHKNAWIKAATNTVDVVDATGAGDVFNGGFLFDWLLGRSLDQCLSTGNSCGSAAIKAHGGTGGLDLIRKIKV